MRFKYWHVYFVKIEKKIEDNCFAQIQEYIIK